MTSADGARRTPPNLATRTVLMLVAAGIVSAFGLVVVDLVTRPTVEGRGDAPGASGEEEIPRGPHVGEGLGEFALQLLLVGGIAFAGRKILKIRL
jgi:hypothetical protein